VLLDRRRRERPAILLQGSDRKIWVVGYMGGYGARRNEPMNDSEAWDVIVVIGLRGFCTRGRM
jgi:hypothetical protein